MLESEVAETADLAVTYPQKAGSIVSNPVTKSHDVDAEMASRAARLRAVYFGATHLGTETRFEQLPAQERARWVAVARAASAHESTSSIVSVPLTPEARDRRARRLEEAMNNARNVARNP